MKRGLFFPLVVLVSLLAAAISPTWGGWQYIEGEGEPTTISTSYQTKAKLVTDTNGYHLIVVSGKIGNTSPSYFAQAKVTLNGSVTSVFGE